ncbi:hypothetical protein [Sulfitobacter donghicola]|nr:hypothetical protein [Sulfitobacter donghicola]KIN68591.1 hypothetical protein Z948_2322 [Sulfitobacter donghicola DSW-25 = KCTC 12864 = JCM 14565]
MTQKLSDTQGQQLTGILSEYDAENLTEDDAKNIVSQIEEAGINAGSALTSALSDAGIDAKELGSMAGVGGAGRPSGPPPGGGGGPRGAGGPPPEASNGIESVDETIVSLVTEAVEAYETSEEADSVWTLLETSLEEAGYDTSENLIDFYS